MWEAASHYYFFAKTFGWTQEQTDAENEQWLLDRLPGVHAITEEVKDEKRKQAEQDAERRAQRGR